MSNDAFSIAFKQSIGADEPLRTGDLQRERHVHALDDHALIPRRSSGRLGDRRTRPLRASAGSAARQILS